MSVKKAKKWKSKKRKRLRGKCKMLKKESLRLKEKKLKQRKRGLQGLLRSLQEELLNKLISRISRLNLKIFVKMAHSRALKSKMTRPSFQWQEIILI